ncbi:MAG: lysostaphin resistance A-like protein [Lachnospiraceae bacterium]
MRRIRGWKVWNIVFPVAVYFLASNLWMLALATFIPYTDKNYMILQSIATCLTLPILYGIYRQDIVCSQLPEIRNEKVRELFCAQGLLRAALIIVAAVCLSIVWNDVIAMSGLLEKSRSYQQTADKFYGGTLFWEVTGTCVLAPLAEELLYRGIVYQRLKSWYGRIVAAIVSALIFGIMHMNFVQFLYAFLFGLFLAYFMEQTGHLYGALLGHMAANLFSVLRTETDCLRAIEQNTVQHVGFLLGMALVAAACIGILETFHKKKL